MRRVFIGWEKVYLLDGFIPFLVLRNKRGAHEAFRVACILEIRSHRVLAICFDHDITIQISRLPIRNIKCIKENSFFLIPSIYSVKTPTAVFFFSLLLLLTCSYLHCGKHILITFSA